MAGVLAHLGPPEGVFELFRRGLVRLPERLPVRRGAFGSGRRIGRLLGRDEHPEEGRVQRRCVGLVNGDLVEEVNDVLHKLDHDDLVGVASELGADELQDEDGRV